MNRVKILYREPRRSQPAKIIFGVVAAHLLFLIPLMVFLDSDFVRENIYDSSNSSMIEELTSIPAGYAFLLLAVLAPLWEETVYRLWMNLKVWTIPIFTTVAAVVLFLDISLSLALVLGIIVLILTLTFINSIRHSMDIHFQWWFYGSSVIFGLSHIMNHQLELGAILFTMPQVVIGVAIGFVRLHYGFFSGVLFHAGWNGLIGLMLLAPYIGNKPVVHESETTYVSWETGSMWRNSSKAYYGTDSLYIENVSLEKVLRNLIQRDNPDAVVELEGASLIRVNIKAKGPLQEVMSILMEDWKEQFSVEVSESSTAEKVYTLIPMVDCEPTSVPGESAMVMNQLGLYPSLTHPSTIARSLENEYEVKFRPGELSEESRNILLPMEGLDSALHALRVYNCIDVEESEEEITRYIIQLPN
ncbi:CPBP family intramembrane glutamic endopeptidase [Phaeocystidibacter marisrubri]|uniref:CPBP family intramembrane metalloprotease n=1 Tax=Phaeocystidibacter marisrubri TaxID=1577780 RepID=A0A6L3ZGZ5_9FLAO|nr:CPBP family intramembrane glutamic endopeptidase [Phaeocystidibacter marisrubri]KAB2816893.1 CPBP family intramembrane metalloprotease [Phaeocystidibacter marisrubri]